MKQLEKMEVIELEDTEKQISFRFPPAPASGRLAIAVSDLKKSYGSKRVFDHLGFELQRGDKMAIVGVNGAGKSTLVKILAGLTPSDGGDIRLGHNVSLSYFGQHQAQELSPQYTVLETLNMVEADKTVTQTRSLLGAFLFRGDEVDKKVQVLSGGEKSRLALAKMIATPANLLVMDEPTNHLDMMSQEILQEALAQYDGTIIIVSHNRYFLDHFVNKVLEIKNGGATLFDGNLAYYLDKTAKDRQQAAAAPEPPKGLTAYVATQLDPVYGAFVRADAINTRLDEMAVDDLPSGSVRFLAVTDESMALRRVWPRPLAIGVKGLFLEVDVKTGNILAGGAMHWPVSLVR